jgi:hypothetical protein
MLTHECAETLAGVRAEPRAHLLHDDEGNGDQHHQKERPVRELRAPLA